MFENLLPEPFNTAVMNLLYVFAEWHALAKLRLQTEDTLKSLDDTTISLGAQVRSFSDDCAKYRTVELPREQRARARREARDNSSQSKPSTPQQGKKDPKEKTLNINTVKMHSLGDYAPFIRECGTTEAYSSLLVCRVPRAIGGVTEPIQVENTHPQLKQLYHRTNKRNAAKQMSRMERIQAHTREIVQAMDPKRCPPIRRGIDEGSSLLQPSDDRAEISARQREYIDIGDWCRERSSEPYIKV